LVKLGAGQQTLLPAWPGLIRAASRASLIAPGLVLTEKKPETDFIMATGGVGRLDPVGQDHPPKLAGPIRINFTVIIGCKGPGQVIGRIEKSKRYDEADTANYDCEGFSMPEPEKPQPEVI
jgi:hypothetical protein